MNFLFPIFPKLFRDIPKSHGILKIFWLFFYKTFNF